MSKLQLNIVKPIIAVQDLAIEINPEHFDIKSYHFSVPFIQFDFLPEFKADLLREFKKKVYDDINDTAVSKTWADHLQIEIYGAEDYFDSDFVSYKDKDIRFDEQLFFMTNETLESFKERYEWYKEEFEALLEYITNDSEAMVDSALNRLVGEFPQLTELKENIRKRLTEKVDYLEYSHMRLEVIEVKLDKSDLIIEQIMKKARSLANGLIDEIKRRNKNKYTNVVMAKKIDNAITEIKQYNVTNDSNINEAIGYLTELKALFEKSEEVDEIDEMLADIWNAIYKQKA